MLEYYLKELGVNNLPKYLEKYLNVPSLTRLKKVGYFCGMDYASKNIYNFREYISRYDHSLTVALLTARFTKNRIKTISGLFHDIATPCFSHVVDYMNKDYVIQESTEEYTEKIIKEDKELLEFLKQDNIDVENIINFKNYSIVDNERPKLCADRLDGIILTGIGWTKNITNEDINAILTNTQVYKNEDKEDELGFTSKGIARLVLRINDSIDKNCHSKEDIYMMELLARITKRAIEINLITYDDLYKYNEEELFNIFLSSRDYELFNDLDLFRNIEKEDIKETILPSVKSRKINPLVYGKRYRKN